MNPQYGPIAWIVIGGLAGWVGSMLMGTNRRQGVIANIVIGVLGAWIAGYIAHHFLEARMADHGLLLSFAVALLGSCIVIAGWKAVGGHAA